MSYQVCRWYDTYPKLAFALKLLYFAPKEQREQTTEEMIEFLDQTLGLRENIYLWPPKMGNRWYDSSVEMARLVEFLKRSPDTLKTLSANKILSRLSETIAY